MDAINWRRLPNQSKSRHLLLYLSCLHYGYSFATTCINSVLSHVHVRRGLPQPPCILLSCTAVHNFSISVRSVWCSVALVLSGYSFFWSCDWWLRHAVYAWMLSPPLFWSPTVVHASGDEDANQAISPAGQRDVANTSCRFQLLLSCGSGWNGRPMTEGTCNCESQLMAIS
jgi:hypothetical protein